MKKHLPNEKKKRCFCSSFVHVIYFDQKIYTLCSAFHFEVFLNFNFHDFFLNIRRLKYLSLKFNIVAAFLPVAIDTIKHHS